MQNLFIVEVLPGHDAKPEQVVKGFLGEYDKIYAYTRGEAIKKARMFKGKIQPLTAF